ncbi:MAG: Ku protein [Bryobacteraceae bacterium]
MAASVWKGYLSFGLVSFPVRLSAAARPEPIHFHMLHKKDLSRIKEVWYCAEEDEPVDRSGIVKGYEYEKGKYVVVEESELKSVAPPTAKVMEILQFVRAGEVDPIFLDKSYYVAPEETAAKPYALLLGAMNETKYYAVAKIAMHGREHIVIIRPTKQGMVLHTMYFVDELHKSNEAGGSSKAQFNQKEMQLAKNLIETLASPFKPQQYEDQYRKNVERLVEQKQKGQKITSVKQHRVAPVVDIIKALQASLRENSEFRPSRPAAHAKRTGRKRVQAA